MIQPWQKEGFVLDGLKLASWSWGREVSGGNKPGVRNCLRRNIITGIWIWLEAIRSYVNYIFVKSERNHEPMLNRDLACSNCKTHFEPQSDSIRSSLQKFHSLQAGHTLQAYLRGDRGEYLTKNKLPEFREKSPVIVSKWVPSREQHQSLTTFSTAR